MATKDKLTETQADVRKLKGILAGIAADGRITLVEVKTLRDWVHRHPSLNDVWPFKELRFWVDTVMKNGVVDNDEEQELLGFCEQFSSKRDLILESHAAELKKLRGYLQGIMSDGIITSDEADGIRDWILAREHISDQWPFTDLLEVLNGALVDGNVSSAEHDVLLEFVDDLVAEREHEPEHIDEMAMTLDMPATIRIEKLREDAPDISFEGKTFHFTGQMAAGTRRDMSALTKECGGKVVGEVTQSLDYLVVGANSNPVWAYATYGRKIERVLELRAQGAATAIVHEDDFIQATQGNRGPSRFGM